MSRFLSKEFLLRVAAPPSVAGQYTPLPFRGGGGGDASLPGILDGKRTILPYITGVSQGVFRVSNLSLLQCFHGKDTKDTKDTIFHTPAEIGG